MPGYLFFQFNDKTLECFFFKKVCDHFCHCLGSQNSTTIKNIFIRRLSLMLKRKISLSFTYFPKKVIAWIGKVFIIK